MNLSIDNLSLADLISSMDPTHGEDPQQRDIFQGGDPISLLYCTVCP